MGFGTNIGFSCGGTAETIEDLPIQPTAFRAIVHHGTKSVVLKWVKPEDENYKQVVIVRKVKSAPENVKDGKIVYTGAAEEYTDTDDVLAYEVPYYYRIFSMNAKGQTQTIPYKCITSATIYDYSAGLYLSDVKIGELINFGRYKASNTSTEIPLQWRVVDKQDVSAGIVTVALETDLGNKLFDQPESGNTGGRESWGNNRWMYSNLRQWLNSDAASGEWYEQQHELDQPPSSYKNNNAFLYSFTQDEKIRILQKVNKIKKANADGGGTETTQDDVWLASVYEVGLAGTTSDFTVEKYPDEQQPYEYFSDAEKRVWKEKIWWLRTLISGSANYVRYVSSSGALGNNDAYNSYGVRPFCNLQSSILLEWDDDTQAYNYLKESAE